jgi:hypothetical protein
MELTEHLLIELRKVQAKMDEARDLFDRLTDVPVRSTGPCVYRELMASGWEHDYAWSWAGRIIGEGDELRQRFGLTRVQSEHLIDVLDEAIGKTGRLV